MSERIATCDPATDVGHLLRQLAPQVLGAVTRGHDDFAAAEDAVQEALIAAAGQWPAAGIPDNPRGWLYRVALRRLSDQRRSEAARRRREDSAASERFSDVALAPDESGETERDDSLVLLYMCCHPALSTSSAIALTLRAVGGLTTAEIASAFLVPEATMAQRISRAKLSIKSSGIPFILPSDVDRASRLRAVLHVLYLIFSEGYSTGAGSELHRTDLSDEAIRLTRALRAVLPHEGEVAGLLALMLLTDARRAAGTGPGGELIPLHAQDRALWNRASIDEGIALLSDALPRGTVGPYQLQASIAALHDEAARVVDTDWPQITALYSLLARMSDNPIVSLNLAVATGMARGAQAGLDLLVALDADPRLAGHHRLDAVRAHLHQMAGDLPRAQAHYRAAAERTMSIPERDYLLGRAAQLLESERNDD